MRITRVRLTAMGLAIICGALAAMPLGFWRWAGWLGQSAYGGLTEEVAYLRGRAEAENDFKSGRPSIHTYGRMGSSIEYVDQMTGLPYEFVAGCRVNETIVSRAAGHNDRIQELIETRGLPANSYKRWERELFDLRGYVLARNPEKAPPRLRIGGPALTSPDGRYDVRPTSRSNPQKDGSVSTHLAFVIRSGDLVRPELIASSTETAELYWGPTDSPFAVLHFHEDDIETFTAVDLQRGEWLREENVRSPHSSKPLVDPYDPGT